MSELFFKRIDRILGNLNQRGAYAAHPYNLNDIKSAILVETVVDEVKFQPYSQAHNGIIEGFVRVDTYQDGVYTGDKCVATVHYCKDLPRDWQNFIVCKELCQLIWVDHPDLRTSNVDELLQVVSHLLKDNKRTGDAQVCWPALTEDASYICAMEILVPWEFRHILMKRIDDGEVTLNEIAERFCCPLEIVKTLFSAEYHGYASRQKRTKIYSPRLVASSAL